LLFALRSFLVRRSFSGGGSEGGSESGVEVELLTEINIRIKFN